MHAQAEARRRSRINERLEALRQLVPHTERANTANFLEELVAYVQRMQVGGGGRRRGRARDAGSRHMGRGRPGGARTWVGGGSGAHMGGGGGAGSSAPPMCCPCPWRAACTSRPPASDRGTPMSLR